MPGSVMLRNDFALKENERQIVLAKTFTDNKIPSSYYINKIINQSKHGPAGAFHVLVLSKILRRCIRVWENGRLAFTFGKPNGRIPIEIEYRRHPDSRGYYCQEAGHWLNVGGDNRSSSSGRPGRLNNCLYEVVGSQTGMDPLDLRNQVVRDMRLRPQSIVKFISKSVNPTAAIKFMMGGASYNGNGPYDAKNILDSSQFGLSHPDNRSGHARGHAYSETMNDLNVQNYSFSRWRSGFLSRSDQDLVCHYALSTNSARNIMEILNRGSYKEAVHIGKNEINYDPLPLAQIWNNGLKVGNPGNFRSVCLVAKHFLNQYKNANADLFVLTFYPIL